MAEMDLDALAEAIDTARRNDALVELPLELAQAIAARLAPASVGGVDLDRWRALIAEYDAGPKHWPDEEQPCTIDLAEARAVVAGLERLAALERAVNERDQRATQFQQAITNFERERDAALVELPPGQPGVPLHLRVRSLRERVERVEAAAQKFIRAQDSTMWDAYAEREALRAALAGAPGEEGGR